MRVSHQTALITEVQHQAYDVIESTQDVAIANAAALIPGTCIVYTAEQQISGRGTQQRCWVSPAAVNLYATFSLLYPQRNQDLPQVPQVVAFAVAEALRQLGFEPELKWVNDVLLNRKKVCGILCESRVAANYPNYFALHIGIGLNVNMPKATCEQFEQPVTSLRVERGQGFDKEEVLQLIQAAVLGKLTLLVNQGFKTFYHDISQMMAYINETVYFDTGKLQMGIIAGILKGIDSYGQLILELPTGKQAIFNSGRLLRGQAITLK